MLEAEPIVALNEIIVACRTAESRYLEAAGVLTDPEVQERFRTAAFTRRAAARRLEEVVRAMGSLPEGPDPDREVLENLWTRFKAAAGDTAAMLTRAALGLEDEIEARCSRAAGQTLPEAVQGDLSGLRSASAAFRKWLEARQTP